MAACSICLEPDTGRVPSPLAPARACTACFRLFMTRQAELGLVRDFASMQPLEMRQWFTVLGEDDRTWVQENIYPLLFDARGDSARARDSARVVHELRETFAPAVMNAAVSDRSFEMDQLQHRIATLRTEIAQLNAARAAVLQEIAQDQPHSLAGQLIDAMHMLPMDEATQRALRARTAGLLNQLYIGCTRCTGSWSAPSGVCTHCSAVHCCGCGLVHAGSVHHTLIHVGELAEDAVREAHVRDIARGANCSADDADAFARMVLCSRNCPACGILVTRQTACPNMRCTACGASFHMTQTVIADMNVNPLAALHVPYRTMNRALCARMSHRMIEYLWNLVRNALEALRADRMPPTVHLDYKAFGDGDVRAWSRLNAAADAWWARMSEMATLFHHVFQGRLEHMAALRELLREHARAGCALYAVPEAMWDQALMLATVC